MGAVALVPGEEELPRMPSPSGALGPAGRIRPLEVRALMTTHRWLGRGADLEVLLLVAQTGSLQAAARAAGITVPSARHRLSRLYAERGIPRGGSQAARAVWLLRDELQAAAQRQTMLPHLPAPMPPSPRAADAFDRALIRRFWAKVSRGEHCWEWQAHVDPNGYGKFAVNRRMRGAHRFSWELHHGPIPDGLFVLHRCDNPRCVRPDHLFLGTDADNVHDAQVKGRRPVAA